MTVLKDIDGEATQNSNFRSVVATGKYAQVVLMSIPPGGEIGSEVHGDTDQVLYCAGGNGKVVLDGKEDRFAKGDMVLVKAGVKHNFVNTGSGDLKIITTYSPPHHPDGTVHKTRAEADKAEAAH